MKTSKFSKLVSKLNKADMHEVVLSQEYWTSK